MPDSPVARVTVGWSTLASKVATTYDSSKMFALFKGPDSTKENAETEDLKVRVLPQRSPDEEIPADNRIELKGNNQSQ